MSAPLLPDQSTTARYLADQEAAERAATLDAFNALADSAEEPVAPEPVAAPEATADTESESFFAKAADFGSNVSKFMATGLIPEELPSQAEAILSDVTRGLAVDIPRALAGTFLEDIPKTISDITAAPGRAWLSLLTKDDPELRGKLLADLDRHPWLPSAEIDRPNTVTGSAIRDIATFGVAMQAGMKPAQAMLSIARIGPKLAGFLKSPLAGGMAMAAIEKPFEQAIEGFVAENPEMADPLAAFFAGPAGEPGAEAVERVKSGLVGLGLGVAADGILVGMRALRARRIARAGQPAESGASAELAGAPRVAETDLAIDAPGTPAVRRAKLPEETQAARLAAARAVVDQRFPPGTLTREEIENRVQAEATDLEVSFDTLTDDASVKSLFDSAVRIFRPLVDDARRGVRTHEQTQEAAVALGFDARDLLARRNGQNLNAEEVAAYKAVFSAAGRKLDELIDKALSATASPLDHFRLRQGYAKFGALTAQFMGARAEGGRALNAWKIRANGDYERALLMARTLEENGGSGAALHLAKRLRDARAAGASPAQIGEAARRGALARTVAAVEESVINGMLWLPATHVVNMASPYLVAAQKLIERMVGRQIQRVTGLPGEEAIVSGEVAAMLTGGRRALRELIPDVADAVKAMEETGSRIQAIRSFFSSAAQRARANRQIPERAKLEAHEPAITSKEAGLSSDTWMGRLVNYFGSATRIPQKLLAFEDDMGKVIGYEMERHALAFREATAGGGTKQQVAERYASLLRDTPENIRIRSLAEAERTTFNNPAGQGVQYPVARVFSAMHKWPVLGYTVFPFVNTPANILRYGFENTALAPLVGQFRNEIRAGGARRDLALARMTVGAAVTAAIFDLAESGYLHGRGPDTPGDREALLRIGIQSDSVTLGDTNVRLNRLDPIGLQLSLAATLQEQLAMRQLDEDDMPDIMELGAAFAIANAQAIESKSWLMGTAQAIDAIRHQDSRLEKYFDRMVTNHVPFASALRGVRTLTDPTMPDVNGPLDAIQSMIPILTSRLPRARDLWGYEIKADELLTSVGEIVAPAKMLKLKESPIDAEIVANGMNLERIAKRSDFAGVPVSFREFPNVYEKYVELAGHSLELDGYGQKQLLDAVVSGKHALSPSYAAQSPGPDGGKAIFVKKIREGYRKAAQAAILAPHGPYQGEEFIRFRDMVEARRAEEIQKKVPLR